MITLQCNRLEEDQDTYPIYFQSPKTQTKNNHKKLNALSKHNR